MPIIEHHTEYNMAAQFGGHRIRPGRYMDATKALREELGGIQSKIASDDAIALRNAQRAEDQSRIDARNVVMDQRYDVGVDLAAVQRKEDLERAAGIRSEDLGYKADRDTATEAYRTVQQKQAEKEYRARRGDVAYTRGMERGEILGSSMEVPRFRKGETITKQELDPTQFKSTYEGLASKIGQDVATTDIQKKQAYMDYLSKNDPTYGDKLTLFDKEHTARRAASTALGESLADTPLPSGNVFSTAYKYGSELFAPAQSKEEQLKADMASLRKPPKPEGVMSEAEFTGSRYSAPEEQEAYNIAAKQAVKDFLVSDKDAGAYVEKETTDQVRVPKSELLSSVESNVADYAKKHPKASRATLLGIRKAGVDKVNKIEDERVKVDAAKVKLFSDKASMQTKRLYDERLATLKAQVKAKYGRIPTELEKIKLQTETLKLQEARKEADSWW